MESSFQLMIAYDMIYHVKFTTLSIKTICRALSLLVLKILAVYWDPRYQKVFNIAYLNKLLISLKLKEIEPCK